MTRAGFLGAALAGAGALALGPDALTAEGEGLSAARAVTRAPKTLQEKVEQLFVVSFAGTSAGHDILTLLGRHALGGVILYARNCLSATQTRTLLSVLQAESRYPLLVCTDQEGGNVVRIRSGAPVFPAEAVYGQIGSTHRVSHDAAATARALRALGLSMNLAPVVDVLTNPQSPIGKRSFGANPAENARLSVAAIKAYQRHGLAAAAKHFIGLGHTTIDSHHLLPTVNLSLQQLATSDLMVFKAAIAAGVSTVLVAHVALPRIDTNPTRPASLSPVIIQGVLRQQLGFKGVIMTDSLLMGAVPNGQQADAAVRALAAGADILLFGTNQDFPAAVVEDAIARVASAVRSGLVSQSRLEEAVGRIWALKQRFPALIPA
jgi:beta-N-acetylhexosaminidase